MAKSIHGKEMNDTPDPLTTCRDVCKARCCRYITVEIPTPRGKVDVDEMRWFLAHENVTAYVEDGQWHLQIYNRCRHLRDDNTCAIYEDRFNVCRDYEPHECEITGTFDHLVTFRCTEDYDRYLEERKAKRSKPKKGKARRKRHKK